MAREAFSIDLDQMHAPELVRLARQVRRTRTPIVLRENGKNVALLSPAAPERRRRPGKHASQADIDAALATFGTWTHLDAEKLLRELDEARRDTNLPVSL